MSRDENWLVEYWRNFSGTNIIEVPVRISHIEREAKNKGKITVSLDIFDVLKKEQLEKLSEDQINDLLEIRERKKKK